MQTICKNLYEEDNEFKKFSDEFPECKNVIKTTILDVEKLCVMVNYDLKQSQGFFNNIAKTNERIDDINFGKMMPPFFDKIAAKMHKVDSKLADLKVLYSELVDYFMIKDVDMRIKSENFFNFF